MSDRNKLESIFDAKYRPKETKGDTRVLSTSEESKGKIDTYLRSVAEDLAKRHLYKMLMAKRLRDSIRKKLEESLADFSVDIDPADNPLLARALQRISGNPNSLTWADIAKSYSIYRNVPTAALGYDPVAAINGQVGDNGEYLVNHFGDRRPQSCDEMADGSWMDNLGDDLDDFTDRITDPKPIDSVMEGVSDALQFTLLQMLWAMLLFFFFTACGDFFNRFRNVPIVAGFVKKVVRMFRRLAARQQCAMSGGADCEQYALDMYPDEDEDDGTIWEEMGEAFGEPIYQRGDNVSTCAEASSTVLNFVRIRSAAAGQSALDTESTIPDWATVLTGLIMAYTDDQFASSSQFLLDTSDFGPMEDTIGGSDITVGEAVDELELDSKQNPIYRIRYYGGNKERWKNLIQS